MVGHIVYRRQAPLPGLVAPAEVKRDKPSLPEVIPGGSPRNPMGVAAMTLSGGQYAIHGTNRRARLAAMYLMAAFACTTTISAICMNGCRSAPLWW